MKPELPPFFSASTERKRKESRKSEGKQKKI